MPIALQGAGAALSVMLLLTAASAGSAQPSGHRNRLHELQGPYGPTSANPYPATAADDPSNPNAAPGAAIRTQARRNQAAPGVTNELAPDNIATATGGPSGGVPGLSR